MRVYIHTYKAEYLRNMRISGNVKLPFRCGDLSFWFVVEISQPGVRIITPTHPPK